MGRSLALLLTGITLTVAGCAKKPAAPEVVQITAASLPQKSVHVDGELLALCKISFNNVERAPKFAFDESELLPADREILVQVARCLTSGPARGREIALVGRADPRGEIEYNMALGELRAESVHGYLALLGVDADRMTKTSRGELDADGDDETGWQRDRRVDVLLVKKSKKAAGLETDLESTLAAANLRP